MYLDDTVNIIQDRHNVETDFSQLIANRKRRQYHSQSLSAVAPNVRSAVSNLAYSRRDVSERVWMDDLSVHIHELFFVIDDLYSLKVVAGVPIDYVTIGGCVTE